MINRDGTPDRDDAPDIARNLAYPSLSALKDAHSLLLNRLTQHRALTASTTDAEPAPPADPQLWTDVEEFIRGASRTGIVLAEPAERWAGQGILEFWVSALSREKYRDGTAPTAVLEEFDPHVMPELKECPYIGLDAFRDDTFFYGRQRLLERLLEKLPEKRLMAIVGSSGSGKSSLVLGGLLPMLRKGVQGSEKWSYLGVMVPGSDPLAALVRLFPPPPGAEEDADAWRRWQADELLAGTQTLTKMIYEAEAARPPASDAHSPSAETPPPPTMLVVDQFEEMVTLCDNAAVQSAFLRNLLQLLKVGAREHFIILTMRSDYRNDLDDLLATMGESGSEFKKAFDEAQEPITPLEQSELRDAIVKPAEKVGLKFDKGVVDALVRDLTGQEAALPLLQFTLLELWKHRTRNRVTAAAYKQIGGRRGLENTTEEFIKGLVEHEREVLRSVLLRLVQPSEKLGYEFTSKRVTIKSLLQDRSYSADWIRQILKKLHERRFIRLTGSEPWSIESWLSDATSSDTPPEDVQVEVAHEALVRNWPTLRHWLTEVQAEMLVRRRLEAKAAEWKRLGQKKSGLLDETQLREAESWVKSPEAARLGYNDLLNSLITESRAEVSKKTRQTRAVITALALMVLLLSGIALVAGFQREKATEYANRAEANALAAKSLLLTNERLDLSLLLGVRAVTLNQNYETRSSLLRVLGRAAGVRSIRHGHSWPIQDVAVRPDGVFVSVDERGNILFQDQDPAAPAKPGANASPQEGDRFALNSDGSTLLIVREGKLLLKKTATDEPATEIPFAPSAILEWDNFPPFTFSADGNYLAVIESAGRISIWDVRTATRKHSVPVGNDITPSMLALSRNSEFLVAADINNTERFYVWDVMTGRRRTLTNSEIPELITAVVFAADNDLLAATDGNLIKVWDVRGNKFKGEVFARDTAVWGLMFVPGASGAPGASPPLVYIANNAVGRADIDPPDERARLSSTETLFNSNAPITSWALSGDGRTLALGGSQLTLLAIRDVPASPSRYLSAFGGVQDIAVSTDGTTLAFARHIGEGSESSLEVGTYDLAGNRLPREVIKIVSAHSPAAQGVREKQRPNPYLPTPKKLDISHDGRKVAAIDVNGSIVLVDVETGAQKPLTGNQSAVSSVAFSPRGDTLASGGADNNIILWDLQAEQPSARKFSAHESPVIILVFSSDGQRLAAIDEGERLIIWDIKSGQMVHQPEDKAYKAVAFSPDGSLLVVGGADDKLQVYETAEYRQTDEWSGHSKPVTSLAFSQDGAMLVSGSNDGVLLLWEVARKPTATLPRLTPFTDLPSAIQRPFRWLDAPNHLPTKMQKALDALFIRPDSPVQRPASKEQSVLRPPRYAGVQLGFATDGKTLAALADAGVSLYDIGVETWKKRACEIAGRNLSQTEWSSYLDSSPEYRKTCPDLPAGE